MSKESKEALLLIDIQNVYFTPGDYLLHEPESAAQQVKVLLDKFRSAGKRVIHVQHAFPKHRELYQLVAPLEGEKIVEKKYPSSFLGTDLQDYLTEHGINKLVVAGMMSHMCIDTTVRACQNYGYKVTVVEDACTTKALKLHDEVLPAPVVHKVFMAGLQGMFAEVMTLAQYLQQEA